MDPRELITIGSIVAPHGVRGDLRVLPQTDFPERFAETEVCYIDGKTYHIVSAKFHKQYVLISFAEITDRDTAETMRRKEIQVERDALTALPEGRYYIFDIIGLTVTDMAGEVLGTVTEVLQPGANDVYVVSAEGKADLLLPVIDGVIMDVDLEARTMTVDPPEWI